MPRTEPVKRRFRRFRILLILGVVAASSLMALVIAAVVLTPRLLSGTWAKERFMETATRALRRPVHLDKLAFTWSDGLTVVGLRVAESPDFAETDLLALDRAQASVGVRDLFMPWVSVTVRVDGLRAQFIRDAGGWTNLDALLSPLSGGEGDGGSEAPSDTGPPPEVPLELTADIRVSDIRLFALDQGSGRRLALSEGRFALTAARLRSEPVTVSLAADLSVDGRELPPLTFSLKGANLFNGDGRPDVSRAVAEIAADLPGVRLDGRVDPGRDDNSLNLKCDVAALTDAAKPLLPDALAPDAASGVVDLAVRVSGNPMADISFETTLTGDGLTLAGGPLGDKSAGPVRLRLVHSGTYAPVAETLMIQKGDVSLFDRTRLSWNGEIRDVLKPEKRVDLTMRDIHLDIGELAHAARPFLPEGMAVAFADPASPPSLTVESAALAGTVPSGNQDVRLNGLVLDMRGLDAAVGALRLRDTGFDVAVPRLSASLNRFFPEGIQLDTRLHVKKLIVDAPLHTDISGLSVPLASLTAAGMRADKPVPDQVKLAVSLGVESARMPDTGLVATKLGVPALEFTMDRLQEALLSATVRLAGFQMDGPAPVSLENLALSDMSFRFHHPDLPSFLAGSSESNGTDHPGERLTPPSPADTTGRGDFAMVAALSLDALNLGGDAPVVLKGVAMPRFQATGDQMPLPELLPRKVGVVAELSLDRLDVAGERPIALEGVHLPEIRVLLDEAALAPDAVTGLVGRISLDQALRLASADLSGLAGCRDLVQSFSAECRLKKDGAALRRPVFSMATASVEAPPYGAFPVKLDATAASVAVALPSATADVEGARVTAAVAPILTMEAEIDAAGSGAEFLGARGRVDIDAAELAEPLRKLPGNLLPVGLRISGKTALDWFFSGRLPDAAEIKALGAGLRFDADKDFPFVDVLDAGVAMDQIAVALTGDDGPPIAVDRMDAVEPIRYRYERKGRQGKLTGRLKLTGVRNAVPLNVAPVMDTPLNLSVSMDAVHEGFQSIRLSQKVEIPLLHLDHALDISLDGLDRMLRSSPVWSGWPKLSGRLRESFDTRQLPQLTPDVAVRGGLAFGLELDLEAGKRIRGACRARSQGLDVTVKDMAEIGGVTVDLNLEKTYGVASGDASRRRSVPLSAAVLSSPFSGMDTDGIPAFLRNRLSVRPTVAFDAARVLAGPVPFDAKRGAATFVLDDGLPVLEPFQADMLGGTVMGAAAFFPSAEGIALDAGVAFTGIDPDTLLPPDVRPGDADREINGRFRVKAPLSTDIHRLLRKLEADIYFSKIGSRALERFLYALDPYESNETIVSQRRLLRTGTPRWVRVGMANGSLSLDGEVAASGVRIAIPALNRLNLNNLPGLSRYGRDLTRLGPVIRILNIMAADQIQVDETGNISIGENG